MAASRVAATTAAATYPPEWIVPNQPIYDGDYVSLRSLAWKGLILKHSEPTTIASLLTQTGDLSGLGITHEGNDFTFGIRRMLYDEALNVYKLPTLDLNKRAPIGWGPEECFVLFIPGTERVMACDTPPHAPAYASTGDKQVKQLEFKLATSNGTCATLGQRVLTNRGCTDFIDQAAAIWYFERLPGVDRNTSPRYHTTKLLIRNMHSKVLGASEYNGGRNLTMAAGSGGQTIKTALHNKDSDDKAQWFVEAWLGNHYTGDGIRRALGARPIEPCRPGEIRNEVSLACKPGQPCAAGKIRGQDGLCAPGNCPAGATRTPDGYCNDPLALPSTASGERNVNYHFETRKAYLDALDAEKAAQEHARLLQEQQNNPSPAGRRLNQTTGFYEQTTEIGDSQLDTSRPTEDRPGYTWDPITGGWIPSRLAKETQEKQDHRTWFEKFWYMLMGYSWDEVSYFNQLLIQLGIIFVLVGGAASFVYGGIQVILGR